MTKRSSELNLLLHPVRIRIVHAFAGGATRTTAQLCARLPDVPQASLYRHVGLLADAGILAVVEERPVRGAIERRYVLDRDRARIDQADAASMTLDDHRQAFTSAMAALLAEFGAYLDAASARPVEDGVGYRQIPVWLSDDELDEVVQGIGRVVTRALRTSASPDRRPYLFSPIIFPVVDQPSVGVRD